MHFGLIKNVIKTCLSNILDSSETTPHIVSSPAQPVAIGTEVTNNSPLELVLNAPTREEFHG